MADAGDPSCTAGKVWGKTTHVTFTDVSKLSITDLAMGGASKEAVKWTSGAIWRCAMVLE
jgi:hypothetical protein